MKYEPWSEEKPVKNGVIVFFECCEKKVEALAYALSKFREDGYDTEDYTLTMETVFKDTSDPEAHVRVTIIDRKRSA